MVGAFLFRLRQPAVTALRSDGRRKLRQFRRLAQILRTAAYVTMAGRDRRNNRD